MKKKLAIFDMDGTLFDTVPANQAAYAVALAPYGVSLSVEDFALHCNGRYYRDFLGELLGGDEAKIDAARREARRLPRPVPPHPRKYGPVLPAADAARRLSHRPRHVRHALQR